MPFLGERPIIGALFRMEPGARSRLLMEFGLGTATWAVGIGVGRFLMELIELNLRGAGIWKTEAPWRK